MCTCSACGWDLTPYPPSLGEVSADYWNRQQTQLTWAQNCWKQLQTSAISQSQDILNRLDQLGTGLIALERQLQLAAAERAALQERLGQGQSGQIELGMTTATPSPGVESSPTNKPEVVALALGSFTEVSTVMACLATQKSVVLDLKNMEPDAAQRTVDFVSGFIHSFGGRPEQLSEEVFLFIPQPRSQEASLELEPFRDHLDNLQ